MLRSLRTPEQDRLVDALRARFEELQRAPDPGASAWWSGVRGRITDHVRRRDPRQFLKWRPIAQTMFAPSNGAFLPGELAELEADAEWEARWSPVLTEDATGTPVALPRLPRSSANLVHHAYHAHVLEETTGRRLEDFDAVLEFGGGYGSFARLAFRLGFEGDYHVHDFPELSALQRYYLESVAAQRGLEASGWRYTLGSSVEAVPAASPDRLFVALWSLSETPPAARERWIEPIAACSHLLIALQEHFEGADNLRWFQELGDRLPRHDLRFVAAAHSPGNHYVIGLPS